MPCSYQLGLTGPLDREVVVHIHIEILLNYKKEHIWVKSNEVDETGAYYTEWSEPEREIQILCKCIYMEFRKMGIWRSYT